jgi:DNA ligase D-like protein (predicted 3'-phosphoesterase)
MHFDFRLECEGVLKSWAVPKGPALDPSQKRLAMRTEDHPFDYASFEGVIPAGQYGAGEVIVWDCGVYSPDENGPLAFHERGEAERRVAEGLEKGKLSVQLRGEKLKGSFALVRTTDAKSWLLLKHKDRFARTVDVVSQDRSVLSGATVKEIGALPARLMPAGRLAPSGKVVPVPTGLSPMQAASAAAPFDDPLKLMSDPHEAMTFLLDPGEHTDGFLDPVQAIGDACEDLRSHEIALMAAMRAAILGALRRVDPAVIEREFDKAAQKQKGFSLASRKSKLWEFFLERQAELSQEAQEDFSKVFGRDFMSAYQTQLRRMKGGK